MEKKKNFGVRIAAERRKAVKFKHRTSSRGNERQNSKVELRKIAPE